MSGRFRAFGVVQITLRGLSGVPVGYPYPRMTTNGRMRG